MRTGEKMEETAPLPRKEEETAVLPGLASRAAVAAAAAVAVDTAARAAATREAAAAAVTGAMHVSNGFVCFVLCFRLLFVASCAFFRVILCRVVLFLHEVMHSTLLYHVI